MSVHNSVDHTNSAPAEGGQDMADMAQEFKKIRSIT